MDDLIIRSLQGRATREEEIRIRDLRARDDAVDRRYRRMKELWSLTEAAEPGRVEDAPDVDALIARAEEAEEEEAVDAEASSAPAGARSRPSPARKDTRSRWVRWGRRAAVGALAAGLMAVSFGLGTRTGPEKVPGLLSRSEIVTGSGEMTTLTLGDGSSIRLGPESRLRLDEEGDRRLARLEEGRAFFGIQSDSTRPFVVRTPQGEAEVLGTRFEVRSEQEEFRVLVVDGSVAVSAGGANLQLSEGEMSRSVQGARPSTERVDDVYAHLDWIGNAIVFQATPLERALREIERRYGVAVRLEDPALRELTVTATFTGRPVDQVIVVLCEILNTTCRIDGDSVRIGSTGIRASQTAESESP